MPLLCLDMRYFKYKKLHQQLVPARNLANEPITKQEKRFWQLPAQ